MDSKNKNILKRSPFLMWFFLLKLSWDLGTRIQDPLSGILYPDSVLNIQEFMADVQFLSLNYPNSNFRFLNSEGVLI